jgi:pyruvate carboxylase
MARTLGESPHPVEGLPSEALDSINGKLFLSRMKPKTTSPAVSVAGKTLLVANRSEIAIRVFRAATELGMRTVAIYAQEDRYTMHRFKADEAYVVGEGKGPVGAYLDIEGIIALARERGVDMIHPGYGFLSENAGFARACDQAGITFVGPDANLLDSMGDKTAARTLAQKLHVPVLPGTEDPVTERGEALRIAKKIGFPLIIKAAFGGGGRGMRVVTKPEDLAPLLDEARIRQSRRVPRKIHTAREAH